MVRPYRVRDGGLLPQAAIAQIGQARVRHCAPYPPRVPDSFARAGRRVSATNAKRDPLWDHDDDTVWSAPFADEGLTARRFVD